VNTATHTRMSSPVWLPVFILAVGSVVAHAQANQESQYAPNQAAPIASVSKPLQSPSRALRSTFPSESISKDYRIGIDDVLTVNVWHETELSRNVIVRPDGKISLPLVGDVQAAGKTPSQLEAELSTDLSQYIKEPELTVIVAEIRSRRVNIIGQVVRPGTFALIQQMGVLDVIAEAGGLKDFAKKKQIYVLRETSAGRRIRLDYNYRDVVSGKNDAQDILLQADDTVVVP
jgi:polysaccharide biosynthesis/export protein